MSFLLLIFNKKQNHWKNRIMLALILLVFLLIDRKIEIKHNVVEHVSRYAVKQVFIKGSAVFKIKFKYSSEVCAVRSRVASNL